MCMALPGGSRSGPPDSLLQRLAQWVGFGVLLLRLFATGLWQWLVQRWAGRRCNQAR